jgi:hypothetical protein
MTWFRVDDGFPEHPKLEALEREPLRYMAAITLWTVMGCDCARRLTDGFVSSERLDKVLRRLGKHTIAGAEALVEIGLWDPVDGGWCYHDWEEYQPTKRAVVAKRKEDAERKRAARANRTNTGVHDMSARTSERTSAGRPNGQNAESASPSPAQPGPTERESAHEAPATTEVLTTAGAIRVAYGNLWSGANAALWPPSQATEDQLRPMVAWVEATAKRERLTPEAVITRVVGNWRVDPWAKRNRYPWATFAKQYANHWQAQPPPEAAKAANDNTPRIGRVVY